MNAGTGSSGKDDTYSSAIGTRLRDARIAHKLKSGDVAEELHLDVGIIEAIECGDMTALPAPIFVQGYVRSYARLVGLPEDELIREFNAQYTELPPLTVFSAGNKAPLLRLPSGRLIRNVILIMLGIILLWLAWPFVERLVTSHDGEATEQVPGRLELPPEFDGGQRSEPAG
jgi:cytoskeletal protein RodZ